MKKYKYKLFGGFNGYPATILNREVAMDTKPNLRLLEHIELPKNTTKDIVVFGAKYVESHGNLNRTWFANEELVAAYDTIPFKALDIEHELTNIVGHIHSQVYVDKKTNRRLGLEELNNLCVSDMESMEFDVLVGAVAYVDRFPEIEGPISSKAFKLSMECYFDSFDILLENGIRLKLEEAITLGLEGFVDQLMGPFTSQSEFEQAHTLKVVLADEKVHKMKVYKYLKKIVFSGAGLVLNPACPSCYILATDRDDCDFNKRQAASSNDSKDYFEVDLRKVDSYIEFQKRNTPVYPVVSDVCNSNGADVEDFSFESSSDGKTRVNENSPAMCPNYKPQLKEFVNEGSDSDVNKDEVIKLHWCTYADKKCLTAGDREDKECYRWIRWIDSEGVVHVSDDFDTSDKQPEEYSMEFLKKEWEKWRKSALTAWNNLLDYYKRSLEDY